MKATNIPLHAPLYPSNLEYFASDTHTITAICEASKEGIMQHLEGTPFNYYTNKVVVEGNIMNDCSVGNFNGSGVIIPVEYKGIYGGYYAYCYVDTDNGIALGREPYGYPKKHANFTLKSEKGKITNLTTRNNKKIINIEGEVNNNELEEPIVKWLPHFMLQIIPEVDGKNLLVHRAIKRDTSQPPSKVLKKQMVDAKVTIEASDEDPIHKLGIERVIQSFYTNSYFHWAPGEIITDFNK